MLIELMTRTNSHSAENFAGLDLNLLFDIIDSHGR